MPDTAEKRSPAALSDEEVRALDAHSWAANHLAVGQIYLMDGDPLLSGPLRPEHVKPRLLGHWGTSPGLNPVIDRVPGLAVTAAPVRRRIEDTRLRHHAWIREHGTDLPEVAGRHWEN